MELKEAIFSELVKKGYSELSDGRKVWDISNRSLLYMTKSLVEDFLKVRQHPRYSQIIIDIEKDLLKKHGEDFVRSLGEEPFNLIDMGCGDGDKAKAFLEALKGKGKVRFCPVGPNDELVKLASDNVKKGCFENVEDYEPYVADLESLHEVAAKMKNGKYKKNVILLLGSILASYDIHSYLFNLTQSMFVGDRLIIGNGIRRGERFESLEVYRHPVFQSWVSHLIKGLGFSQEEIEYDARFANGRVECFYKLKIDKTLQVGDRDIDFRKGDEVIVAVLYKFYGPELEDFCKMYFREADLVRDSDSEYALVLCKK
jgi:uncharacterized SAM-dependent methyltransferase